MHDEDAGMDDAASDEAGEPEPPGPRNHPRARNHPVRREVADNGPPPRSRAAMTAFLWYLLVLALLPVGWALYAVFTGGAPACSGVLDCAAGFARGLAFLALVEMIALVVTSPVLVLPVGVTYLIIVVTARTRDPVKVGRLAALAGMACVVVPLIVLYRVHGW